ncbi:MAG: chorismate mutase [Oscillospiraceae bacterium]|nr:chorismate mutase [Oscillospiraceae bacterium]
MELKDIRKEIDSVDDQILALFLRRMDLVHAVSEAKKHENTPIFDPGRERAILEKVHHAAGKEYATPAHQLFQTMMELSRAQQTAKLHPVSASGTILEQMIAAEQAVFPAMGRVACSGIEGSHAQAAAEHLFPRGDLVHMEGFPAVFRAVKAGLCQYGVVPIENSNSGSVRAVYDLLRKEKAYVVRSIRLAVHQVLLAKPGVSLSQIHTIYSHEQAINQCSTFLAGLSGVDVIPCTSTAHAAKRVSESKDAGVAAIASEACVKLYGLALVQDGIQNHDNNGTRFLCITKDPMVFAGANRISLIVSCANRPGALYEMIAKISAMGVNMCKLESAPVSGSNFAYRFYLDLEASIHQEGIPALLADLERSCESFAFLGNYTECAG